MTDNSESTFQPHSDEELARLLEDQMRAMRSAAPITAPQPTAYTPRAEPETPVVIEEELGIDDLFGALLEETTDISVVQVEEEVFFEPSIDDNTLEHTQPITYIHEEVIEVAMIEDHIVVEETVVEEVIEDAQVIAERVLSEISIDGEIVATTISETAGADPIPLMFGDAVASESIVLPVSAVSMSYVSEPSDVVEDIIDEEVLEEVVVKDVVVEKPFEFEAPVLRLTNPISHINSFAPRPSFDELVFGVKSDD